VRRFGQLDRSRCEARTKKKPLSFIRRYITSDVLPVFNDSRPRMSPSFRSSLVLSVLFVSSSVRDHRAAGPILWELLGNPSVTEGSRKRAMVC